MRAGSQPEKPTSTIDWRINEVGIDSCNDIRRATNRATTLNTTKCLLLDVCNNRDIGVTLLSNMRPAYNLSYRLVNITPNEALFSSHNSKFVPFEKNKIISRGKIRPQQESVQAFQAQEEECIKSINLVLLSVGYGTSVMILPTVTD
jgi:hypothetical protein